jgi:hypothetical protein
MFRPIALQRAGLVAGFFALRRDVPDSDICLPDTSPSGWRSLHGGGR